MASIKNTANFTLKVRPAVDNSWILTPEGGIRPNSACHVAQCSLIPRPDLGSTTCGKGVKTYYSGPTFHPCLVPKGLTVAAIWDMHPVKTAQIGLKAGGKHIYKHTKVFHIQQNQL